MMDNNIFGPKTFTTISMLLDVELVSAKIKLRSSNTPLKRRRFYACGKFKFQNMFSYKKKNIYYNINVKNKTNVFFSADETAIYE